MEAAAAARFLHSSSVSLCVRALVCTCAAPRMPCKGAECNDTIIALSFFYFVNGFLFLTVNLVIAKLD